MNAGLGNLTTLKAHLLAASMQAATDYDTKILAIGLGVAGLIDGHCNRKFAYEVDAQEICTGDRDHYYVERYPFTVISHVEMRYFMTDNWTDIDSQPIQINEKSGLVHFGYMVGRAPLQVRITYTGGFFFETKEPADGGYPTAAPDGAALLPDAVRLAWLIQCAEVWNKTDKLGAGIAQAPDAQTKTGELELSPIVKTMLRPFIRYQLT